MFDLPAARLSRADVEELANLVTKSIGTKQGDRPGLQPDFSVDTEDSTYRAHSIDELLSHNLPDRVKGLSIHVNGWTDDNDIDRSISIDLRRTVAQVQIYALDEIWFKGMNQKINEFFRNHRRWYGIFYLFIPAIFGILQGIVFALMGYFYFHNKILISICFLFIFVSFTAVVVSTIKGNTFPLVDIWIGAKRRAFDREVLVMIFTAISALATVASVILQLIIAPGP